MEEKIFSTLNTFAKRLCEYFHFERYCVEYLTTFYSIVLLNYKGEGFNCYITIMDGEFREKSCDYIMHRIVDYVSFEVEEYEYKRTK